MSVTLLGFITILFPSVAMGSESPPTSALCALHLAADVVQAAPRQTGEPVKWSLTKDKQSIKPVKNAAEAGSIKVTNGNGVKVKVTVRDAEGEIVEQDTLNPGESGSVMGYPQGGSVEIADADIHFDGANGTYDIL